MPQTVEIDGIGSVEFPDSMSIADINSAIEKEILPQARVRSQANRGFNQLETEDRQVPVFAGVNPEVPEPTFGQGENGGSTVQVDPAKLDTLGRLALTPATGATKVLKQGIPEIANGDVARGGTDVVLGTAEALTPTMLGLGAGAPVDAAAWYAVSRGLGGLGRRGAKALGASDEDADRVGGVATLAPLLYGGYDMLNRKAGEAIDAHNARADALNRADAKLGQQMMTEVEGQLLGENIVGPDGLELPGTDGWKVVSTAATPKGRPGYSVLDKGGQIIRSGTAGDIQDWLASKGIEKSPVPEKVAEAIVEQIKQEAAQGAAARKQAALSHIRDNPDASVAMVRQQFQIGERTAQRLFDFVAGERNALAQTQAQPQTPPTAPAADTQAPVHTANWLPAWEPGADPYRDSIPEAPAGEQSSSASAPQPIVKSPHHYEEPGAPETTPVAEPAAPAAQPEPTKVEIPGVGTVEFPAEMKPEEITAAIEKEILPQAQADKAEAKPAPKPAAKQSLPAEPPGADAGSTYVVRTPHDSNGYNTETVEDWAEALSYADNQSQYFDGVRIERMDEDGQGGFWRDITPRDWLDREREEAAPKPAVTSPEITSGPAVSDSSQANAEEKPEILSVAHDGMLTVVAAHRNHRGTPPDVTSLPFANKDLAQRGLSRENVIGAATFTPLDHEDGNYHASTVEVVPEWQRKGIATALYQHAENTLGTRIVPSKAQTKEGEAFSQSRSEPESVDAEENPTETLSYRNKGNHKINIHLKQTADGWHHSVDYNLQGFQGGTDGSNHILPTREAAIADAIKNIRRHLAQTMNQGSTPPKVRAEATRMVQWLDSQAEAPKATEAKQSGAQREAAEAMAKAKGDKAEREDYEKRSAMGPWALTREEYMESDARKYRKQAALRAVESAVEDLGREKLNLPGTDHLMKPGESVENWLERRAGIFPTFRNNGTGSKKHGLTPIEFFSKPWDIFKDKAAEKKLQKAALAYIKGRKNAWMEKGESFDSPNILTPAKHEALIKQSLAEGKPVPQIVLDEYLNLQKKPEAQAEPAAETKPLAERSTEEIEAEFAHLQKQEFERTERYETDDKYYGSPEDRQARRAFTDQTEPLKAELSKRKAAADAAHNRELQRKQDRDRLERALTIRPQNPTVKDVDAQHSKDIPATYSLADYRGGNRLLKATGQASIVQTFDTQEWQWSNEYTGPAVKARERFAEYTQSPLTQEQLDQETKYIHGEWSERHGVKPAAETKDHAEQKPEKHPVPEINRNPQKQFLESIPSTDPNVRVYEVNRWPNGKIQVRSYNSALGSSYGTNFDTLEQAREQVAAWNKQNDERKAVSAQSGAQKAPKQSGAQREAAEKLAKQMNSSVEELETSAFMDLLANKLYIKNGVFHRYRVGSGSGPVAHYNKVLKLLGYTGMKDLGAAARAWDAKGKAALAEKRAEREAFTQAADEARTEQAEPAAETKPDAKPAVSEASTPAGNAKRAYHVAPEEHTGNLLSLFRQHGNEAYEMFAQRWPEAREMGPYHAHYVHLYNSLAEAQRHQKDFGGKIYSVDLQRMEDDLYKIERDKDEFDHLMVSDEIPAEYIEPVKQGAPEKPADPVVAALENIQQAINDLKDQIATPEKAPAEPKLAKQISNRDPHRTRREVDAWLKANRTGEGYGEGEVRNKQAFLLKNGSYAVVIFGDDTGNSQTILEFPAAQVSPATAGEFHQPESDPFGVKAEARAKVAAAKQAEDDAYWKSVLSSLKPEITLSPAAQESERLHRENVAERHSAQEAEEQEQTFRTEYQRLLAKARKEAELDYDEDAIRATQKRLLLQGDDKHASAQVGERHAVIERKTEKVGHGKKATSKTVFAARLSSDRGQPREFTFDNAEQAANWATENLYGIHGANGYGGGGHFVSNLLRTGSLLDNTNRGYAAAEAAAIAIGHPELRQAIYQGVYYGGAYGAPLDETLAEVRRKHSTNLPGNESALVERQTEERHRSLLGTGTPNKGYRGDWENQLEGYELAAKGLLRNLESVRERFETARIVNGGTHPEIEKREKTFNEYETNIQRNLEFVREQTKAELAKHRGELEPKVKAAAAAYAKYGDAAFGEYATAERVNGRTPEMEKARYAKLAGLGDNVSWPKLLEHFGIKEQPKPEPVVIPTGKDKLLKEEREALPKLSLDGESYIGSPGARARFQTRGWADNEGQLTDLGKRAVYTIRTNDNESLNGLPIADYQAGKGTLASPGESRFGSASNFWAPVKGEVWHTNGHGAWAGDFPSNWPKRDEAQPGPDISKVIPEKKGQTLKPIGFNATRRGPTDTDVHRHVYFSNGAAMSAEYFDYTNKRYGQVTWTQEAGKDSNPFQAWKDAKRVAVVMPLRGDDVPANLKGFVTKAKEAAGKFLGDETGTFDPEAMTKRLSEFFHGKDGEPERNYSGMGALKSKVVRNLSQIEEASPRVVHPAAVKAGTSTVQASVMMRSAWRNVDDALAGKVSGDVFRQALIESRLRGIRQRWLDLANGTQSVEAKDLLDWVLSGPIQLLDAMSPDVEPGEPGTLAQQAASLAENLQLLPKSKWNRAATARLRSLVTDAFEEAADSVHEMMTDQAFQDVIAKPEFQKALAVYKRQIEAPLAKSHAENEGVFSTALGPLATYYPLTPIRAQDEAAAVMGARRGFKRPGNIMNHFATGLADNYDSGLEAFREKVEAAIRVNDKAALIDALAAEGMLRKLAPGETADSIRFRGRDFRAIVASAGPARVIVEPNGKITRIAEQRVAIPEPFYHELKPILEPDRRLPGGVLQRVMGLFTQLTLKGPADFAYHAHNLIGVLTGNTPYLGIDLASKTIGNTPVTKILTALVKLVSVDPLDERATRDLRDMAQLGILPEKFGTETYSKKYAEATGAKHVNPWLAWWNMSPTLYGPKGIDVRARLVMYRLAKEINPNASSVEIYKFVNQLGNYTQALQAHFERAAKRTGLSPFYTAGSTMLRNGLDTITGSGSGAGPGGGLKNRLAQQLSGSLLGMALLWMVAYKGATGKWPWEDKHAKFGKIPAPAEVRNSAIGLALWGHDTQKTGYINLFALSPHVSRGARALGIDQAISTAAQGGNWKQVAEGAKRDVANSLIHPLAGPLVRTGMLGFTGKQPYLVGDSDHGGSQFLNALPKKAPLGSEVFAAAKQLNSFYGNVGAATGLFPSEDQRATFGEKMIKAVTDMTGVNGGATNVNLAHEALRRERRTHK